MEIEFDPVKDETNRIKHGLALADAVAVFEDPNAVEISSIRKIDEEERYKTVGFIGERLHTVIFVRRESRYRIISFRPSNPKEIRGYERS